MRNVFTCLLLGILLSSCAATKETKTPTKHQDLFLGIEENYQPKKYDRDSLFIVSPAIQLGFIDGFEVKNTYENRDKISRFVLKSLKSELNTNQHFDLGLTSKSYCDVNEVLHYINYFKSENPEWILKAPKEVLIQQEKYTVLIYLYGRYHDGSTTKVQREPYGIINFLFIDNEAEIINHVHTYKFKSSPLNFERLEKLIHREMSRFLI